MAQRFVGGFRGGSGLSLVCFSLYQMGVKIREWWSCHGKYGVIVPERVILLLRSEATEEGSPFAKAAAGRLPLALKLRPDRCDESRGTNESLEKQSRL